MSIKVYELVEKFTAVRLFALLINAAVLLYLIYSAISITSSPFGFYLVRQKEK